MSKKTKKKRKLKISRVIILSILLLFVIGFGSTLGFVFGIAKNLPEWKPADLETDMTSFVYDANGNTITKLHKTENRTPVNLKDMPPYLIDAFIATEDVRFMNHYGVDVKRIAGAFVADIRHMSFSQGASTITMQLVRNAILETQEKKMERKIKEALLALQVERQYTKEEILYFYLNEIYFGHGANGVQAAAQTYFGKNVGDLTLGEAAIITGVVKGPRYYSPFLNPENALKRRDVVLNNMVKYDKISKAEAEKAKAEPLKLTDLEKKELYIYPWFNDYVIEQAEDLLEANGYDSNQLYTGGFRIYTTLDPQIQKAAEEVYDQTKYFPKSKSSNPIQSAMAVLEPKTGEIKALIGGREHLTKRGLNRATSMKRQPGSTIKPISVYAPALEKGYSPGSVIDDVPVVFGSKKNPYSPANYDGKYRGLITIREAVQWSVNIPAVKMLNEIGVSEGYKFAKSLGLPLRSTDKNLALALGGIDQGVSPLDMAAAYATFANQGVYIEPHVITKIVDHKGITVVDIKPNKNIVMSEQTAYLITDILKTVVDAGTGTRAKLNRPVAGKTGTTQLPPSIKGAKKLKGAKDTWFAAYTPELVGVVWIGYDNLYDDNGKLQYLHQGQNYGGKYPAMIWKAVIEGALKNVPVKDFQQPSGIMRKAIDVKSGKLPSNLTPEQFIKTEVFAKKNVPTDFSNVWVTATIDPETGLLANEYCPTKITKVFLKRPEPYPANDKKPEDAYLEVPTNYCPLHSGNTINNGTISPESSEEESPDEENLEETVTPNRPEGITHSVNIKNNKAEIHISWKNNNNPNVLYKIERWSEKNPNEVLTFRSYSTSFIDTSPAEDGTYYYRIYAIDEEIMASSEPTQAIKISISNI